MGVNRIPILPPQESRVHTRLSPFVKVVRLPDPYRIRGANKKTPPKSETCL